MVLALANQSLLSKFAEAGYVSVCDGDKVKMYDGRTATITVLEDAVLKGWWCPRTKLWRIPLQSQVTDLNMHTLLLNAPTGRESLNSVYNVPTTASVLSHIKALNSNHTAGEATKNVYKLPSLARVVRYLNAAAGFPTKATCIKIIRKGNYLTWPLLIIHNVNRHFPKSKEIQKGHTQNQRQGVRSTKEKYPHLGTETPAVEKKRDVFINVYEPKGAMYTY